MRLCSLKGSFQTDKQGCRSTNRKWIQSGRYTIPLVLRYPLQKQPPGKVILLNCEDDLGDTIAPRLDKANADDTKIIILDGISMMGKRRHFSLEADVPRLEEVLKLHQGVRLIVIDPVSGYLGKVDSHNNSEVRGVLAPLADLASRFHVAILTVTHLAKSGGTKAVYRAMAAWSLLQLPGLSGLLRKILTILNDDCSCQPN